MSRDQIIHIHPAAPPKPALGTPCNGCGVCCLLEPCPVGVLVSRRRTGACKALLWSDAEGRYRCGMVSTPGRFLPWSWRWPDALVARWSRRLISAGSGCDAALELQALPADRSAGPDDPR
jgi:hypothetical protein